MSLDFVLDLYAALVGLVAGSYLNVVIYRLPRETSTVLPRSRCPRCDTLIRARDNIPLLSFLLLRGRCRSCAAPIPLRYPVVEALTAILFVACLEAFGPSLEALVAAVLCCLLVALAAIDLEHFLLPDRLTLPGILLGIAAQGVVPWAGLEDSLLGVAVGAGILLAAYGGWWLLRREEGMGLGDVKMLAMIGAFLGWQGALVALFFGALSGAVFGLTLMAVGGGDMKSRLPFGTFLAAGAVIALFFGRTLITAYLATAYVPLLTAVVGLP